MEYTASAGLIRFVLMDKDLVLINWTTGAPLGTGTGTQVTMT